MIEIAKYIGIPFESKGASFETADCFGLVRLFYWEEFRVKIPQPISDYRNAKRAYVEYLTEITSHWKTIRQPKQFCVVAMAHDTKIPTIVQHFGIYIDGLILHSLQKIGSHIAPIERYAWAIKAYHEWVI